MTPFSANRPIPPNHGKTEKVLGHRAPDFFVVGHPKCGTTALYHLLRGQPDIFLPSLKEPMFLASDMKPTRSSPMNLGLPQTMHEYLGLFSQATPNQLIGDMSTTYLVSKCAAANIKAVNEEPRIVAIFREPASFLRSLHLQALRDHNENVKRLGRALALEERRLSGKHIPRKCYRPQALCYTDYLAYTTQLKRYHDVVGKDRILTLIYDDLRLNWDDTVDRILSFLGVTPLQTKTAPPESNTALRVRSQTLDESITRVLLGYGPVSKFAKRMLQGIIPPHRRADLVVGLRERIIYSRPLPVDGGVMHDIRVRFRDEVERFGDYIGRNLISLWDYDSEAAE